MTNCKDCKHMKESNGCCDLNHLQYWDADLCVTVPLATEMGSDCTDFVYKKEGE